MAFWLLLLCTFCKYIMQAMKFVEFYCVYYADFSMLFHWFTGGRQKEKMLHPVYPLPFKTMFKPLRSRKRVSQLRRTAKHTWGYVILSPFYKRVTIFLHLLYSFFLASHFSIFWPLFQCINCLNINQTTPQGIS